MARSGWSAANFLRYGSGLLTAAPLSIAAWAKTSVLATDQGIVDLHNSASAADRNCFRLYLRSTNQIGARTADGANASLASSSTTVSANTWFHAAAVFASATSRAAYLNGAGKGTDATNTTPSGINRTSIGVQDASAVSDPFAPAGTGSIAEVGIWNIALSDADIAALATGVSPLLVHPEALVGYWPLIGNNSPENNLISNAVMSVQGSLSASAHPRLILPHRRRHA